jgi:hypothetical protein
MFKTSCQWQDTIYMFPQSAVGSFVDAIYVKKVQIVLILKFYG